MVCRFFSHRCTPVNLMRNLSNRDAGDVRSLFSAIVPRYDLANHLLSAGLDFHWRRQAAATVARWDPARVLDLATGTGDLAAAIRRAAPRVEVVALDFCQPMLVRAAGKGVRLLVTGDAMALPFGNGTFDCATVAFGLRNMEPWSGALRELHRVLAADGHLLLLDFSLPKPPFRAVYRLYLHHMLPRIAGLVTGRRDAYEYLAGSIERFPSGQQMVQLLHENGFCQGACHALSGGIVSLYTASK
jgi:demethylmenaquinone methyltransferase/2-methoxy-6-polyprenyl-1,4-benzoquinol methylase